jgi:xanthine dehydrogenase/oxidase
MSMYSLLKENAKPTAQEVEDSFDGNLCRCTGYRPILDAMKSLATPATDSPQCSADIEDLCRRTGFAARSRSLIRSPQARL